MTEVQVTWIGTYCVCNDCGASGTSVQDIQHAESCIPGSSDYWQEYYSKDGKEEQ